MYKITKKAISEAPEFILGIDWKADYKPMTIDLQPVEARDFEEAMKEAEKALAANIDKVWCIGLFRKTAKVEDDSMVYRDSFTLWERGGYPYWTRDPETHETCRYSLQFKEPYWA